MPSLVGSEMCIRDSFYPLGLGGLLELDIQTLTVKDVSPSLSMPDQTQFHGRIVAMHGEPTTLYALVLEAANTRYHFCLLYTSPSPRD